MFLELLDGISFWSFWMRFLCFWSLWSFWMGLAFGAFGWVLAMDFYVCQPYLKILKITKVHVSWTPPGFCLTSAWHSCSITFQRFNVCRTASKNHFIVALVWPHDMIHSARFFNLTAWHDSRTPWQRNSCEHIFRELFGGVCTYIARGSLTCSMTWWPIDTVATASNILSILSICLIFLAWLFQSDIHCMLRVTCRNPYRKGTRKSCQQQRQNSIKDTPIFLAWLLQSDIHCMLHVTRRNPYRKETLPSNACNFVWWTELPRSTQGCCNLLRRTC